MNPIKTIQNICFVVLFVLPFGLKAQNVGYINDYSISSEEFVWLFNKHNKEKGANTYNNLSKYLDLYINYKLKVLEAKKMKMDLDSSFIVEVQNFEKIIKPKYKFRKREMEFVLNEYKDGVLMFNVTEKLIWEPLYASNTADAELIEKKETEWIKELRSKYKIVVVEEELKKLSR